MSCAGNTAFHAQVGVVGAGPAGLEAARAAARAGARVILLDMMSGAGGRIWAGAKAQPPRDALRAELDELGVRSVHGARVVNAQPGRLLVEQTPADGSPVQALWMHYDRLIVATGARELQLPFPGWTLPGVVGAGGLQLMVKSGMPLKGRRVMLAGTGPLLLAAADTARRAGAQVACVAEQAPAARLWRFALGLHRTPDRAWQALRLRASLGGMPYTWGRRLLRATAGDDGWLREVLLADGAGREHRVACDLLATGQGLVPELGLPRLLGCALNGGAGTPEGVRVDELCATSVPDVWAAGESTGVGGVEKARIEGRIAGLAAAGRTAEARALLPRLARERGYAQALHDTFWPRPGECPQPEADTLVCRCEDVRWSALQDCAGWREARVQQRCGMGHCQGRVCGSALSVLKGWTRDDVRAPLVPARVSTLAQPPLINH